MLLKTLFLLLLSIGITFSLRCHDGSYSESDGEIKGDDKIVECQSTAVCVLWATETHLKYNCVGKNQCRARNDFGMNPDPLLCCDTDLCNDKTPFIQLYNQGLLWSISQPEYEDYQQTGHLPGPQHPNQLNPNQQYPQNPQTQQNQQPNNQNLPNPLLKFPLRIRNALMKEKDKGRQLMIITNYIKTQDTQLQMTVIHFLLNSVKPRDKIKKYLQNLLDPQIVEDAENFQQPPQTPMQEPSSQGQPGNGHSHQNQKSPQLSVHNPSNQGPSGNGVPSQNDQESPLVRLENPVAHVNFAKKYEPKNIVGQMKSTNNTIPKFPENYAKKTHLILLPVLLFFT